MQNSIECNRHPPPNQLRHSHLHPSLLSQFQARNPKTPCLLPPIKVQIPAAQEQEDQITSTESNHDPEIPPSRVEANRKRLVELVADAVSAVLAIRSRVVGDVARAAAREEGAHVLAAGLARRGGEEVQFAGGAGYELVVQFGGDWKGGRVSVCFWIVDVWGWSSVFGDLPRPEMRRVNLWRERVSMKIFGYVEGIPI